MKRFIRPEIMTGMTTCSKIAKFEVLNNESHVDGHDVDVGFAARHTLRSVKCNERTKLEFFMDCQVFLVKMIDKMLQRSPLRYSVVRYAPCFLPHILAADDPELGTKLMRRLLDSFLSSRRASSEFCEKALKQYYHFRETIVSLNRHQFQQFKNGEDRLDVFLSPFLHGQEDFTQLYHVLKCILCLFTGQAEVERGFSVNKEMLCDNMRELSRVSQGDLGG
jgi:hypothetical protein